MWKLATTTFHTTNIAQNIATLYQEMHNDQSICYAFKENYANQTSQKRKM